MQEIVYWTEIGALLSMAYFQQKKGSTRTSILLFILILVVISETLTKYDLVPGYHLLTINILIGLQMSLYMFFYLSLMKKGRQGKAMVGYLIFFLLFWIVISVGFQSITEKIQTLVYIAGAGGVLVFIMAYVHQDLLMSERAVPVHHRYLLWVSAALFFYLAAELPVMTMIQYMIDNNIGIAQLPIFQVKFIVSIIYYATYPIALIWAKTV